jgi:hypothetical protein
VYGPPLPSPNELETAGTPQVLTQLFKPAKNVAFVP